METDIRIHECFPGSRPTEQVEKENEKRYQIPTSSYLLADEQQSAIFTSSVQASFDHFLTHLQGHILSPRVPQSISEASMNSEVLPHMFTATTKPRANITVMDGVLKQDSIQYESSSWITYLFGSLKSRKRKEKSHTGKIQKSEAVYYPPAWISTRAWQCMYIKDLSSLRWNIDMQAYRTLGPNSVS
ncbi:hypothetical protein OCU04_004897 [Sclerotinia nivalis]|uniref:Uncharacterized protein n=1 Tax=Sclerotinia nivalis TaxID=352851 RepID=A0A9X0ARF3_9HELO|nr:hypothetical protein OCU04_004897 [Sclerotinia nivalis]